MWTEAAKARGTVEGARAEERARAEEETAEVTEVATEAVWTAGAAKAAEEHRI